MATGESFYRVSDRGHGITVHNSPLRVPVQRKDRPRDEPVVVVRAAPPAAVALALHIAGGDASRLVFGDDGSVTVANKPRGVR
jgi:hypothetical protein